MKYDEDDLLEKSRGNRKRVEGWRLVVQMTVVCGKEVTDHVRSIKEIIMVF